LLQRDYVFAGGDAQRVKKEKRQGEEERRRGKATKRGGEHCQEKRRRASEIKQSKCQAQSMSCC
jgi:hypothetical protein